MHKKRTQLKVFWLKRLFDTDLHKTAVSQEFEHCMCGQSKLGIVCKTGILQKLGICGLLNMKLENPWATISDLKRHAVIAEYIYLT